DYWRFTPEALKLLLADYPSRIIGWHGPKRRPLNVWGVAMREQCPPISETQYVRYRTLVTRYARQPLSWPRRLRYQLGRWICGRRPFSPYLEQEGWESEWHVCKRPKIRREAG